MPVKREPSSTPKPTRQPLSLKKQSSSAGTPGKGQSSILGFFSKKSSPASQSPAPSTNAETPAPLPVKKTVPSRGKSGQSATPIPSSDALDVESSQGDENGDKEVGEQLLSPRSSPAKIDGGKQVAGFSSPSRKAKKVVSYAEDDDEDDDEDVIAPARGRGSRSSRSKSTTVLDDGDDDNDGDFAMQVDGGGDFSDDDMDDFMASYASDPPQSDSDAPIQSKKRKRPATAKSGGARKRSNAAVSSPSPEEDTEIQPTSTAQQWRFNANQPRSANTSSSAPKPSAAKKDKGKQKEKAHTSEPGERYPWLANILDGDRNPPGHPDYDPRTIYIPPKAWDKFTPFETQYWEIKQKFWDTIVFFKKGKFYELYENDATIGHQLFDLKLTDRVNMRMVGVPEASLDTWANQFVAKGFKIAKVVQCESKLAKDMRERDEGPKPKGKSKNKADNIIKRELSCVLTGGTLVEGSMLQDDMSTYCVSIKEGMADDLPAFGVSFVDAATGQFFLCEFVDDVDLTKFETLIAQIRPSELILEKSHLSVKANRILKNNTTPTTIWNHLKPGTEFWEADMTRRELDFGNYFTSQEEEGGESWPEVLNNAKGKDLLMSAFGGLVQYLRTLKLERDLLSQGNFTWYDPIQKATTLVLDGQTLINLEVFANSFDGGAEGTLFQLLNRCVTPFGKRMFRQWVCHPLADAAKINERLDAVEVLNADRTIREQFTHCMMKMPDLERLISRIHAGVCKPEDFVRVLDGFEQIDYTMSLLSAFEGGGGILDRLVSSMPDMSEPLKFWKTAFDHKKARDDRILIPEPGVEEDFDASQARIAEIEAELQTLLKTKRRELSSNAIQFKDVGKEIYQLEVPAKIKGVPKEWQHMSATKDVKRYYFPELKDLVRELQEAQETHAQNVKEVAGRLYARFDEDYKTWLAAVKIVAQLDCLIGLAKASSSLGEPSCRPVFVDDERTRVEFEELRHPCVLPNVTDFIPNDIKLGGDTPNINLLTGANAAGKSTVLRMTCVAVIMAQIGCHVPCVSATLTPIDRIMSRLGANDNIFAAQSTFFVELSETSKILSESTPRSLVILDELGRGTSSYDGVAVAQAVLHHIASHVGCVGFFATHYHSLAEEFKGHPEVKAVRMKIRVEEEERKVVFLYRLEEGTAEGSYGMHCAAMCGIPEKVVQRAEEAAREWEHTSRLKESLERAKRGVYVPLGMLSDVAWVLREGLSKDGVGERGLEVLRRAIEGL